MKIPICVALIFVFIYLFSCRQKRIRTVNKRMSKIKITFKRHCTEGDVLYGSVSARNIVEALSK